MLSDEALALYELAFHLKMPVYKILDDMPYEELLGWYSYLEHRPPEWRDDDRAFKYLQTQGYKGKPWEVFPALKVIYNPSTKIEEDGMLNVNNLKGSFIFNQMLTAKGGTQLDFNEIERNG